MADKTLSIQNDVPGPFLKLFESGGPFSQMADLARESGNTVDLQFRNTHGRKPWATLYLGTSKIVDIHFSERRGLKIEPQKSEKIFKVALGEFWKSHAQLRDRWNAWELVDEAAASWRASGASLIASMMRAEGKAGKFTGSGNEGYLQAGIAKPGFFDRWSILNRESIVAFESTAQQKNFEKKVHEPVDKALKLLWRTGEPWTRGKKGFGDLRADGGPKTPKGFGNKLDALGVDIDGNLVAIEVKGGYDPAGVRWTPAQVMVYKRLLDQWLENTLEDPHEVLGRSLRQRQALGLAGSTELAPNFKIIPMIVVGEIESEGSAKTATERMNAVWDALEEFSDDLEDLRVFQLEGKELRCFEIGRREPLRSKS